ncbi:ferredoxin--NADP reductase [Oxalobacteraceae bacterium R-40]|uniref:ferredoxin--NADP(+) reductase n=1 Tax=Keguizhuia sedimenti TaxID=3064264 RepID=A0ABU1BNQ8_9BURK|nr:ferredoxin--NADP reductase [Oxalobacteraceae bacterium R-40]
MSNQALASDKATLETVTQVKRWTDNLLTFKTTKPAGYRFDAGQYARLGLFIDGQMVWRAYSLTSAPDDDFLEYYGVIVPGGMFTTELEKIKPGDSIWTEKQVYGFMTPGRFTDGSELWMLATGTGLGPYVSILRDPEVWQRFRHLVLVHCVRHADELAYQDELNLLKDSPPGGKEGAAELKIVQSVTRDPGTATAAQPGVLHGRITTLLNNGELEKHVGLPITIESSRIMLCGNPSMIEETRAILHHRGLRPCRRAMPGQFVTENYW